MMTRRKRNQKTTEAKIQAVAVWVGFGVEVEQKYKVLREDSSACGGLIDVYFPVGVHTRARVTFVPLYK